MKDKYHLGREKAPLMIMEGGPGGKKLILRAAGKRGIIFSGWRGGSP